MRNLIGGHMRRRKFILLLGGVLAAWPLAAHPEQNAVKRVGIPTRSREKLLMQTTTKMILAICCIGAVAVETLTPVYAQRWNTWNGCRPGWTVQGGRCQPYRWGGSGYRWQGGWNNNWGGGWNTSWNGCPRGWTIQ